VQTIVVDARGGDDTHGDACGALEHGVEEPLALVRIDLLGVVEPPEGTHPVTAQAVVVEQDTRDYERAGERSPPGLVGSGDEPRPQTAIEPEKALGRTRHPARIAGWVDRFCRSSVPRPCRLYD
jgi:hypothetical protein